MVILAQKWKYSPTPASSLNLEWPSHIATLRGRALEAHSERWIWGQRAGGEVRQRVEWCWGLAPLSGLSFPGALGKHRGTSQQHSQSLT